MIKAKIVSAEKIPCDRLTYKFKLRIMDTNPKEFLYAYVDENQINGLLAILNFPSRKVVSHDSQQNLPKDPTSTCESIIEKLLGLSASIHMNSKMFFVKIFNLSVGIACENISKN